MRCAITKEQQEEFVDRIFNNLLSIERTETLFDPKDYINNVKNSLLESLKNWEGNKEELVTDYMALIPGIYTHIYSNNKTFPRLRAVIKPIITELGDLQELAEDPNRYEEFKNILFPAVSEEDILKSQEEFKEEFQREQEQNAENVPAPKAEPTKSTFSAKANSPLATTQQVAKDNVIDPTQLVYD